jgi:hypothetical protein
VNRLIPIIMSVVVITLAGTHANAEDQPSLNANGHFCKMTREDCARKAVEAMAKNAKFPFAEITEDGNARGWNAKYGMLVISFPTPDPESIYVEVITSGWGSESEHTSDLVRNHICNGPIDSKSAIRVVPEDGKVPPAPWTICWKSEVRPSTGLLRHFESAAAICLEKKGYNTKCEGGMALGGSSGMMVVAFKTTTSSAQSTRLVVAYAAPGPDTPEKANADLLSQIMKILFE